MPLTQGSVIRAPDTSGDYFKTYQDGSLHIQMVVVGDDSGSPLGNPDNPVRVKGQTTPAFQLNSSGSEQQLTVGTTPIVAGSFHASTTHVLWSCSGGVRVGFLTPPASDAGHYFPDGYSAIWEVTLFSSASFVRAGSADASVYITPLTWS